MQNSPFPLRSDRARDVVCVGTALIDHLSFASLEVVRELGLAEGAMTLVDLATAQRVAAAVGPGKAVSGGTVANTAVGVAGLGGRPAFVGAVANDELGGRYRDDLEESGVQAILEWFPAVSEEGAGTGACYVIVTPNAERTMATTLGVSGLLGPGPIDDKLVASASLVYFDGYLLDFPQAESIVSELVTRTRAAGTVLAMGLADPLVVARHYEKLVELLPAVDVVFANEAEAIALSGSADCMGALEMLARQVTVAVVTRGQAGAVLAAAGELVSVPAAPVQDVIDVTGAGDLFAAGVCYGLTSGLGISDCGRIGALCAAEVISHLGARPATSLAGLVRSAGLAGS